MERHVLDRAAPQDGGERLRRFLAIARGERPASVPARVQRQPRARDAGLRLREFLRIARGRTA
jgi:hypothetical protein